MRTVRKRLERAASRQKQSESANNHLNEKKMHRETSNDEAKLIPTKEIKSRGFWIDSRYIGADRICRLLDGLGVQTSAGLERSLISSHGTLASSMSLVASRHFRL